jgi:hypothetical protein
MLYYERSPVTSGACSATHVKRGENDAADAEILCEAANRPDKVRGPAGRADAAARAQAMRSKYLLTPLARESRPHMPLALLTNVPVRATNGFEVAQGEYQQQNLVK